MNTITNLKKSRLSKQLLQNAKGGFGNPFGVDCQACSYANRNTRPHRWNGLCCRGVSYL